MFRPLNIYIFCVGTYSLFQPPSEMEHCPKNKTLLMSRCHVLVHGVRIAFYHPDQTNQLKNELTLNSYLKLQLLFENHFTTFEIPHQSPSLARISKLQERSSELCTIWLIKAPPVHCYLAKLDSHATLAMYVQDLLRVINNRRC